MRLEIKNIYSPDIDECPNDPHNFAVLITVDIGEKDKDRAETFYFVAVSPSKLQAEANGAHGFRFLRGHILMNEFDWSTIHRAIENLVNHAQSRSNWHEVISFFNRYGTSSSEDLDSRHYP